MKSQFTPGPWWRHDTNIYVGDTVLVCCPKNHWSNIELPEAEKLANARLIASAPDLLASLVELESMVAEMLPKHGPCGWGELALNQARQAIAKATGNNA